MFDVGPAGEAAQVPADIAAIAANSPHLRYIVEHLAALALVLFARPWGLSGVGMALVQIVYDVADAFVLHHLRHDPWCHWKPDGPRQPAGWDGDDHPAPVYAMDYEVMGPHLTVESRWLDEPRVADGRCAGIRVIRAVWFGEGRLPFRREVLAEGAAGVLNGALVRA
ncbi:hypothetical protein [Kitasatospora cineracea]|uniref:hypothetical protein n=1 Tax=Kitasatospora cineracea TaxID=88074 RepID=UPI0036BE4BBF